VIGNFTISNGGPFVILLFSGVREQIINVPDYGEGGQRDGQGSY
jgi:hypothetical protein